MDKTIFSDTRARIERYVASNRLKDAFETVATLAAGLSNRKIGNEIAAAEQSYHYMLDYAMQGADDPGRAEMARDLGARILALTDGEIATRYNAWREGLGQKIVKANADLREVHYDFKTN